MIMECKNRKERYSCAKQIINLHDHSEALNNIDYYEKKIARHS